MAQAPSATHVPAFDGFRAVAALMVVGGHVDAILGAVEIPVVKNWLVNGPLGVDLFFVLSGHLITGILLRTRASPDYWRSFWIRRFLRILPAYWLLLGVVAVHHLALGQPWVVPAWAQLAFVANWWFPWAPTLDTILIPTWSLCVEEQFYILWPFFVAFGGRRGVLWSALGLAVICPLIRWDLLDGPTYAPLFLTHARVDSLAMGAAVAALLDGGLSEPVRRLARLGEPAAIALVVGLGAYDWVGSRAFAAWGFSVVGLLAALVVLGLQSGEAPRLVALLEGRFLGGVGRASYSLYLFNVLILFVGAKILGALGLGPLAMGAVLVPLAVAFATLVFRTVEEPALSLKERWAPYRRAPEQTPR